MKINQRKEKAKKEFIEIVENSEYKMLTEYDGADKKVDLECPRGHKWSVTPSHFKNGVRCPRCNGNSKEQAKETFFKMVKDEEYKCYSEYTGNKNKVDMECPKGHKYKVRPNDFMTGHRCRFCGYDNEYQRSQKEKSYNDLAKIAYERGFEILGQYVTTETKIKMKCPKGHIRMYTISHFKQGFGCPVCYGSDPEEAEKDLLERTKAEGYEVIGQYINVMTKIDFKCPFGHIYKSRPNDFKNGLRCPICGHNSYGEDTAKETLLKRKIKFECQKTFDGLFGLGGGKLKFDFYIPSHKIAIEIQGEQHFEYDEYLTNNTMEHDELKRKFCERNNIKLYEINYFRKKLGFNKAKEEVRNTLNNILDTLSL
jgi:very-short-patch-repair endonuclease